MHANSTNRIIETITPSFFFGNYFYGICAVSLSIEAALQQKYPLNTSIYYFAVFFITVLFYTKAYLSEQISGHANPRMQWYAKNHFFIIWSQRFYGLLFLVFLLTISIHFWQELLSLTLLEWTLILLFPTVAAFYYGVDIKISDRITLRSIGWLKPFLIGFVWAGIVTIYPILYYNITHSSHYIFTQIGFLLFIKNLMFITMLCVLFDIKDFSTDSNHQIQTFVVKSGLRKTIFYFVIPMTAVGLGLFILYGYVHAFHPIKILLNTIPFTLLIFLAYSLHKPKSILYYLVLIDGLMLVKALCGSAAMLFF